MILLLSFLYLSLSFGECQYLKGYSNEELQLLEKCKTDGKAGNFTQFYTDCIKLSNTVIAIKDKEEGLTLFNEGKYFVKFESFHEI
jgi:hypothetical protein